MKAIIFAGGTGKRLWPLSRKDSPKQVHKLFGELTALEHSVDIVSQIVKRSDIYIATGIDQKDEIKAILSDFADDKLILESSIKDTGPAVGYSLAKLSLIDPNEPVLIYWQNGYNEYPTVLSKAVKRARDILTNNDAIDIVYVASPSRSANTSVGYIKRGELVEEFGDEIKRYEFLGFKEKPDDELVKEYFEKGYAWNTGYYVTTPRKFLKLIETYAPDLYEKLQQICVKLRSGALETEIYYIYDSVDKVAIDYIISENLDLDRTTLIIADYGWNYVSTWDNLYNALRVEDDQNVTKGICDLTDTKNSLVFNDDKDFLVATVGVDDICVVKDGNAVLVCSMKDAYKVKDLYDKLASDPKNIKFV